MKFWIFIILVLEQKGVTSKRMIFCTSQFENRPRPPPPHPHLTGVLFHAVGNLTQNEAHPVWHLTFVSKWRSAVSPAKGFCNSFRILLCSAFMGHCSYIHCYVGAFEKALNVGGGAGLHGQFWNWLVQYGHLIWWEYGVILHSCNGYQDAKICSKAFQLSKMSELV